MQLLDHRYTIFFGTPLFPGITSSKICRFGAQFIFMTEVDLQDKGKLAPNLRSVVSVPCRFIVDTANLDTARVQIASMPWLQWQ
jgi:hypothetical protein